MWRRSVSIAILRLIAGFISLTGCDINLTSPRAKPHSPEYYARKAAIAENAASYPQETLTQAGLRARYAGATTLDYNEFGTIIRYFAPDGTIYAWWRGEDQIIVHQWTVKESISSLSPYPRMCPSTVWGEGAYNEHLSWDCRFADEFIYDEDEYARGDPFNLASGQIPYVLKPKRRYTFDQVSRPLGFEVQTSK